MIRSMTASIHRGGRKASFLPAREKKKNSVSAVSRSGGGGNDGISAEEKNGLTDPNQPERTREENLGITHSILSMRRASGRRRFLGFSGSGRRASYSKRSNWSRSDGRQTERQGGASKPFSSLYQPHRERIEEPRRGATPSPSLASPPSYEQSE